MFRLLLGWFCIIVLASCGTRAPLQKPLDPEIRSAQGILHLHCTWTEPYCGGAELDPSEYPRPHPWQGKMYLRPARPDSSGRFAINDLRSPILDTIHMNVEGDGYLALPAGSYLLLDRDHADDRRSKQLLRDFREPVLHQEPIDTACLRHWLHGPFGVLAITSGDTLHLDFPQNGRCPWEAIPCVYYNGPLPP